MALFLFLFLINAVEVETFTPLPSGVSTVETRGSSLVRYEPEEGFLSGEPGAPLLPLVSRVFILPGNCRVTGSEAALQFTGEPLAVNLPIRAAGVIRPLSAPAGKEARPTLLSVTGEYPLVSLHEGTILNAVTIVSVTVNPWRYLADTGELSLASSCRLELEWEPRGSSGFLSPLQAETVNYRLEQMALAHRLPHTPVIRGTDSGTDYLIITGQDLIEPLAPLVNLLQSRSYTVETISVQDIHGGWPGADTQERIRNCVKDHALNQGTAYVLIAGDETVVPVRDVYTECEGHIEFAPSDLYYADIDGTWDKNGNGIYGEQEDSLDLYADVILARLLFSTEAGLSAIISKNIEYSGAGDSDWYSNAVVCGAQLFPEIGYSAEKGCELLIQEFPGGFEVTAAYETAVGDYPDTYFPVLYSGAGWNHYAGHGSPTGVWWGDFTGILTVFRTSGFQNPGRYGIHSSIGCHVGDFTAPSTYGSLADTLLTLPGGGGIACLFNTTWGWEGFWPEIGSSERMCNETVSQVYVKKASTLGLAYTTAKDLEIPYMTGPYDRVLQSLLGYSAFFEPSLRVLGVASSDPVPPDPFTLTVLGPNPASSGSVAFRVTGLFPVYDVTVYSMAGRVVSGPIPLQRNSAHTLDTSELHTGVYFLRAASPGGLSVSESFVVLN